MLPNFAPSCLNRDDTGSPKECEFGGYRRARISSQCIKRAIRTNATFRDTLKDHLSVRSVSECAKKNKSCLDSGMKPGDVLKKNKKGKFVNLPDFPVPRSADIGLFGRMVTSMHFHNIDTACQIAHAISANKVNVEFDYYTAVDDLQPKETASAGMIGTMEFNSACYYRYANIHLRLLKDNLGRDEDLARRAVQAFLRAAVTAVPSGKQTSMSAPNPPSFVFAVVRDSGTWSLANAFAKPVHPGMSPIRVCRGPTPFSPPPLYTMYHNTTTKGANNLPKL